MKAPRFRFRSLALGCFLTVCIQGDLHGSVSTQRASEPARSLVIIGTVVSITPTAKILLVKFETDKGTSVERRFIGLSTTDIYRRVVVPERDEHQEVKLMMDWEDVKAGNRVRVWYETTNARNLARSIELHD